MTETKLKPQSIQQEFLNGWINASETWEYVSVDDPTGVIRANADLTGILSVGMRIKMTNGGNVIYGIITVVGSYTGGYTSITFLHQIDPTDSLALYLMANSAITANYYSTQKAPFGFPLSPSSWTTYFTNAVSKIQTTPTAGVWYNLGSLTFNIPIGLWNLSYSCIGSAQVTNRVIWDFFFTLSTANNTESDTGLTVVFLDEFASQTASTRKYLYLQKILSIATKTAYYCNAKTGRANLDNIAIYNADVPLIIKMLCAYL